VSPDPAWRAAVERAGAARVTLVLGATDTGKTSLTTHLAARLAAEGRSVAVVDADLGQSDIGPPTTVGLGRIRPPLLRLGDAEVLGLYFVGATSPEGHLAGTVTGTRVLTERARQLGFERVIVDTSGLIQGELGRRLKRRKIEEVDPDLVLCLQRADECEHILRDCPAGGRPDIVRLPAATAARRRSAEERRLYRQRSFETYLAAARPVRLDLRRVVLRPPVPALDDCDGVLAGLEDARQETLGLGVVRTVEPAARTMVVLTPVPGSAIAAVRLGSHRLT
jgi:polynucleotide 5'-hydroxyl-kinase GRC3/NOL9